MEESPELMVVMTRIEAGLLSSCVLDDTRIEEQKRISMILQEAIRQREEATLSNEVDIRSSNKQFVSTRLQQQYGNE